MLRLGSTTSSCMHPVSISRQPTGSRSLKTGQQFSTTFKSFHTRRGSPLSFTGSTFSFLNSNDAHTTAIKPVTQSILNGSSLFASPQCYGYATRSKTPKSKQGRMNREIPPEKLAAVYRKWRSEGRNLSFLLRMQFFQLTVRYSFEHPRDMVSFAEELVADFHKDGIDPPATVYTHAIQTCARAGEVERAFKIFNAMSERGVQPDYMTYMALIRTCALKDMEDRARSVFDEMFKLPDDVLPENREGVTFELMYKTLKTL
eukprot:gb/GECH01013398.1/.p1 GENE.gb/GECH01013398.1/~~gb/GECH01013398.1/.p1  ORF type:complete len:259 (+),score=41.35 gb/GECH01013398.1/:1-777(+)